MNENPGKSGQANGGDPASAPSESDRIACARCEHENPRDLNECARCGADLWTTCRRCGERNPRVSGECSKCRHRLHRGLFHRRRRRHRRPSERQVGIALVKAGAVALALLAGWGLFHLLEKVKLF